MDVLLEPCDELCHHGLEGGVMGSSIGDKTIGAAGGTRERNWWGR
jgi:hypothetical protein